MKTSVKTQEIKTAWNFINQRDDLKWYQRVCIFCIKLSIVIPCILGFHDAEGRVRCTFCQHTCNKDLYK